LGKTRYTSHSPGGGGVLGARSSKSGTKYSSAFITPVIESLSAEALIIHSKNETLPQQLNAMQN